MRDTAIKRGGFCLSNDYINNKTKLKWQCKEGHTWGAVYSHIQSGTWCPFCSGHAGNTIEKMNEFATKKGGKCLSEEYVDSKTKLKWRCKDGHEWDAVPSSIKRGMWCPYCGFQNVKENIVRIIFKLIFSTDFPKKRPRWLRNKKGNLMELDGYSEKLMIAFEYHGEQHFEYSPFFHKSAKYLEERKLDDTTKAVLCRKKDIRLIEIPHDIKSENFYSYILNKCRELNIQIPVHEKIDIHSLISTYHKETLHELKQLAVDRGGNLLSSVYLGDGEKHKWQCKEGHVWEANVNNTKKGAWCPFCANNIRHTIEKMNKLAEGKGGRCLSYKYVNSSTNLKWQCKHGHVWETSPGVIKQGKWCPHCSGNARLTIKEMKKMAEQHGGECLSIAYINSLTKLKWKCKEGHIWETTPTSIKSGNWCSKCSGHSRLTLQEMKDLAHNFGGECLSKRIINGETKLKWKCKQGHIWEAIPFSIKRGHWCRKCYNNSR